MKPNFFILGAPKCGTTSLVRWLSEHPRVFLSEPKEPKYFNSDFDLPFRPRTQSEYEALFSGACNGQMVGEATTGYLCSDVALQSIIDYNPDARFVICLRPPVDLFFSLHQQRLKEGYETLRSPIDAWNAQSERLSGNKVPIACPDPKLLHYERFCRLGEQVSSVLSLVSSERVHIVLLEDMAKSPQMVNDRLCEFLGIPHLELPAFAHENAAMIPRSLALSQTLRILGRLRRRMRFPSTGLIKRINRANLIKPDGGKSYTNFREMLVRHFEEDVCMLESMLAKNLDPWRKEVI